MSFMKYLPNFVQGKNKKIYPIIHQLITLIQRASVVHDYNNCHWMKPGARNTVLQKRHGIPKMRKPRHCKRYVMHGRYQTHIFPIYYTFLSSWTQTRRRYDKIMLFFYSYSGHCRLSSEMKNKCTANHLDKLRQKFFIAQHKITDYIQKKKLTKFCINVNFDTE